MGAHSLPRLLLACSAALCLSGLSTAALAEGSRNLYPAAYPSTGNVADGARANLDLQTGPGNVYLNRVVRRGFIYAYAEAGEYILTGSSNVGAGRNGQINVYNPQDFGTRGNETVPGADFTCTSASGAGSIASRAQELAGPNSTAVNTGYNACSYQAPVTGIYGVVFSTGAGGGPNARVDQVPSSSNSVAAWDVTVRSTPTSAIDLNGRVHTFAFPGYTGGNNRPLYSTLYYVTADGYRYQQDLRGLDPNGYALYANTFGFLDNSEPLYKTLRGDNATLDRNLPAGVTTQQAQYPMFFSDITAAATETEMEKVLSALGIPLVPPSPEISDVQFTGAIGGRVTATGVGGTFSFNTTDTVSYQIVISQDRVDFNPANPNNRVLTGIAYSGFHQAEWDGLDNSQVPFPASPIPYPYRAYGRNGEVHFPIIDAENNSAGPQPGGPTITRLNGTRPNDTTVFFDDRGYVTSSGEAVGDLNGFLCGSPTPAPVDPPVNLEGVDSGTNYRGWPSTGNDNSDCDQNAGWGDAKAVNLWTYFLTPEFRDVVEIVDVPVDLGTTVAMPASADPGANVAGVFSFVNNGTTAVNAVSYSMSMTPALNNVSIGNLPGSATATYDVGSGVVTFTGLPTTLNAGQLLSGMTFSYDAPPSGTVTVTTGISTAGSTPDTVPENDTASASTAVGAFDVYTRIMGIPATANPGDTVNGNVIFSNAGPQDAGVTAYTFNIGEPGNTPQDVQFTSLPAGVGASYDDTSGVVTLTGMPAVLAVGDVVSIVFSYTAPDADGAAVPIVSGITPVAGDAEPNNNAASASTLIVAAPSSGPSAPAVGIPTLPLAALLLLLGMVGLIGGRQVAKQR